MRNIKGYGVDAMKALPVYKFYIDKVSGPIYCTINHSGANESRLTVFAHETSDVEKLECPTVTINQYYNDSYMTLDDVIDRVNNGLMHERAIALVMELLL